MMHSIRTQKRIKKIYKIGELSPFDFCQNTLQPNF